MSKGTLIDRLLGLPDALIAAELRLHEAETCKRNCEAHLQLVEDQLLLGGLLDGKNSETRAAQQRRETAACREAVAAAGATVAAAKIRRDGLQAEFSALKSVARLIAAGGEA